VNHVKATHTPCCRINAFGKAASPAVAEYLTESEDCALTVRIGYSSVWNQGRR
jgi:hypothetical protein